MRMHIRKKNRHFLYIAGIDNQTATCTKLLNIKYEFYGFSGDLMHKNILYTKRKVV